MKDKIKQTISITDSDIKNMVKECVESVLNEHVDEVFQLNTAINLINKQWESPDDFWYVYISQRYKDNVKTFQKNHVGDGSTNFRVNFIAYGVVSGNTKEEAIESLKKITMNVNESYQDKISTRGNKVSKVPSHSDISSIIMLCNRFNARCYMTVNKRSMVQANNYADALKSRGMEKGREFQFAAGRQMANDDINVKWTKVRPWGLIDCDIDDPKAQAELEKYLEDNGIKYEEKYESHDGMHYLFSNRDAAKLKYDFFDRKYRKPDPTRRKSDPLIMFKGDACMLLYSPCGY